MWRVARGVGSDAGASRLRVRVGCETGAGRVQDVCQSAREGKKPTGGTVGEKNCRCLS